MKNDDSWLYQASSFFDPSPDEMKKYLDCCFNPDLEMVRLVYDSLHDQEKIHRCRTCGAYFYERWMEQVDFEHGDDPDQTWYSPLTKEEADHLLEVKPMRSEELEFLATRERTVFVDGPFIAYTRGQPPIPQWVPRAGGGFESTGVEYWKWFPWVAGDEDEKG